jgi:hypothetical protein
MNNDPGLEWLRSLVEQACGRVWGPGGGQK